MTGTAGQQRVPRDYFAGCPVPLPPIAEQKRIVAKVDELMEMCDRLEAAQQNRNTLRQSLRASAFDALMNATTDDDLNTAWTFIYQNWPHLSQHPQDVEDIRRSVLQLAVRGKLVPQDPEDGSAKLLSEQIKVVKQKLIDEGKIRKASASKLEENDIPYDVPAQWLWSRFNDVILDIEAGSSPQCEKRPKDEHEWGIIKISAISWDKFNPDENKALPKNLKPNKDFEVKIGDFLMSRANTSQLVGKSVVVEATPPQLLINDKTLRVLFPELVDKRFFNFYNNSYSARSYYAGEGTGTSNSMKNITRSQIRDLPVPLPPLAEQKRIVAKVDELMQICDQLEANLQQQQQLAKQLAASAVSHLAI